MPGNLSDVTFASTGRQPHSLGEFYEPEPGDVIWSPKDAGRAWSMSPDTVIKYCVQGRCKHIKVAQEVIILQRDRPEPAAPGTLTDEQRAALGKGRRRR